MSASSIHRSFAAGLVGALLLVGGCSSSGSDDDSAGGGADVEVSDGSTPDTEGSGGDSTPTAENATGVDCQALQDGYGNFVTNVNIFTVADNPETIELGLGDAGFEQIGEYLALLRPIQDVDSEVFGTLRSGLDNLESDIALAREGQLDERVGDYNMKAVATVVEKGGC